MLNIKQPPKRKKKPPRPFWVRVGIGLVGGSIGAMVVSTLAAILFKIDSVMAPAGNAEQSLGNSLFFGLFIIPCCLIFGTVAGFWILFKYFK